MLKNIKSIWRRKTFIKKNLKKMDFGKPHENMPIVMLNFVSSAECFLSVTPPPQKVAS